MKNLIVGVAAAAVLAAGALVFTSVKVSARVQEPYIDVYIGCTGPVIPAYTADGRTVGVCADRSIYQCSAHCDAVLEPDEPIVGPDVDRYPGDTFLPGDPAEYKKDEKDNWNRIK